MSLLEELLERTKGMAPEALEQLSQDASDIIGNRAWIPNPGPQTQAYISEADIILYGGRAGGGKTHLELGWGINEADRGIIFRRELTQTDGIEDEGKKIIGESASFNGTDHEWTWPSGKSLKLGAMSGANDWMKHAGRERDYMAFDEAGEFLEQQVASIMAWLRASPGKRTRVVLASNPPRTSDGFWMLEWFAPWLDPKHPYPAAPGELRWGCYVKDHIEWVDGPGEYMFGTEPYLAKSYTFIPASLEDNPFRNTKEYRAKLQSLPEPLRSQLLYGDFEAGMEDDANQCIPTSWIRMAQERWTERPPDAIPMCAIGVDCSGGGEDPMVMARRHDGWYDKLITVEGSEIPKTSAGKWSAGRLMMERRDQALVVVDMGGGYGGPLYEHLNDNHIECYAYKGAEATNRRTQDKKLGFTNVRSGAYYTFREALDPGQPGGSPIALPPSRKLLADLAAPTFEVTARGIKLESKEDVTERLGRSTDEGDAVVMSWWVGDKAINSALEWAGRKERLRGERPKVIKGRQSRR